MNCLGGVGLRANAEVHNRVDKNLGVARNRKINGQVNNANLPPPVLNAKVFSVGSAKTAVLAAELMPGIVTVSAYKGCKSVFC